MWTNFSPKPSGSLFPLWYESFSSNSEPQLLSDKNKHIISIEGATRISQEIMGRLRASLPAVHTAWAPTWLGKRKSTPFFLWHQSGCPIFSRSPGCSEKNAWKGSRFSAASWKRQRSPVVTVWRGLGPPGSKLWSSHKVKTLSCFFNPIKDFSKNNIFSSRGVFGSDWGLTSCRGLECRSPEILKDLWPSALSAASWSPAQTTHTDEKSFQRNLF